MEADFNQAYRALSSSHGPFGADLAFFWHGIIKGRKYPFNLYTPAARDALRDEVVRACSDYYHRGRGKRAERLLWLWESINAFIIRQNARLASGSLKIEKPLPPSTLPDMLKLLYGGQRAGAYWARFSRAYHLKDGRAPLSSFWDHFDSFQPARLDVADWLSSCARGKILDLGAGSYSYIPVHVAADISKKSLSENKMARNKIQIKSLAEPSSLRRFPPASFDTVMLNSVLSYLPRKSRRPLFHSIRSILGGGGTLLITNAPVLPHHPARIFTKSEVDTKMVSNQLRACGFEVEDDSEGTLIRISARKK
ncbi:MAG: class I SAM-dependent methyltransferase [Candidatus Micrarchaeota archaeon]